MANIVLPVPGESPNWATTLNTAILRINQELEALGVQVSIVQSDISSITLAISAIDGRVSYLEDNIEDVVRDIAADVIANDPTIIQAAEDAVDDAVADLNIVQAYPEVPVQQTSLSQVPLRWTYKVLNAPVPANVTQTVEGTWNPSGQRRGDIPVLTGSGLLRENQIPASIARLSDIPEPSEPTLQDRVLSSEVPIFAARLAVAKVANAPVPVVFVGSSTTYSSPGFVVPFGRMLQETWRNEMNSSVQRDNAAQFTQVTSPGVHIYNAGHSGTTAATYLTDEESDRIAALNPALINHMVGSNDWRQGQSPATYRTNLENRLDYLDSVITGPHQHVLVQQYERRDGTTGTGTWAEFKQVLMDLADERPNVAFLDLSEPYYLAGSPVPDLLNLISSDDVHQTPRGYAFMAACYASFYFTG